MGEQFWLGLDDGVEMSIPGEWRLMGPEGEVAARVSGHFRSSSGNMLYAAMVAGAGIGLAPTFVVGSDLAEGRLIALMPDYQPVDRSSRRSIRRGNTFRQGWDGRRETESVGRWRAGRFRSLPGAWNVQAVSLQPSMARHLRIVSKERLKGAHDLAPLKIGLSAIDSFPAAASKRTR
jgi:hypothetical protein